MIKVSTVAAVKDYISCGRDDIELFNDGSVTIHGDVRLSDCSKTDNKIGIMIREIDGDFDCSFSSLASLEGCPQKIGGDFYCNETDITSLAGCSQWIGGDFYCSATHIANLIGGPTYVGENYVCRNNPRLTSLAGSPRKIYGVLDVSNTSIVNFDDGPDGIRDGLCAIHTKIVNLHGAPVEVGSMNISDNPNLTSLIGLPKTIIDDLHVSYGRNLGMLTLAQSKIGGFLSIYNVPSFKIIEIFKRYNGHNDYRAIVACAAELISAGYGANAKF